MTNENHFENVVETVKNTPQNQRTDKMILGIAQQLQQADNPQTQQFGQELNQIRPRLTQACQQQS